MPSLKAVSKIIPRRLSARPEQKLTRHWCGGDPFLTAYHNALSMVFPAGERFFMDAVRVFKDQITDPALQQAVQGFLAQESLHSREHAAFNAALARFGIDAASVHAGVSGHIAQRRKTRRPIDDLAVTCALEHFTALLADGWLQNDWLRAQVDEELRALWTWHAIEEIEHKSVAFDVYQAVGGDYATRAKRMMRVTVGFSLGIAMLQYSLLKAEGQHQNYPLIARGLYRFWGPRGMLTRLIPGYLRYYLPSFHPSQHDQSALLARFDRELRERGLSTPVVRAA